MIVGKTVLAVTLVWWIIRNFWAMAFLGGDVLMWYRIEGWGLPEMRLQEAEVMVMPQGYAAEIGRLRFAGQFCQTLLTHEGRNCYHIWH